MVRVRARFELASCRGFELQGGNCRIKKAKKKREREREREREP